MKKLLVILTTVALACGLALSLTACNTYDADHTITVGASQTPHAEILKEIKGDLKAAGYRLVIKTFDDYITPNTSLEEGSIDANYFQHTPYLNEFNAKHNTHLVAVGKIHYEPFGVYGNNVSQTEFDTVKTGRSILVPNDGSNLTRALFVLQDEGYITLAADAKPTDTLTVQDIADSKGNTVNPVQAETVAQLLRESPKGTIAVINGNYALQAQLDSDDALAFENAQGDAAQLYANVVAVKEGNEGSEKTTVLLAALKTQKVYDYITNTYDGAVLPVFTL